MEVQQLVGAFLLLWQDTLTENSLMEKGFDFPYSRQGDTAHHNREGTAVGAGALPGSQKADVDQEVKPSYAILKTHPSDVLPPARLSIIL